VLKLEMYIRLIGTNTIPMKYHINNQERDGQQEDRF